MKFTVVTSTARDKFAHAEPSVVRYEVPTKHDGEVILGFIESMNRNRPPGQHRVWAHMELDYSLNGVSLPEAVITMCKLAGLDCKVSAVRMLRALTRCSLKEAVDFYREHCAESASR